MPTEVAERPRVYLDKVHLKGYKSIEDLTIDFQKGLNILIGKNGAGKSNFMEFIENLMRTRTDSKPIFRYAKLEFLSDDNHSFVIEQEKELHIKINNEYLSDTLGLSERFSIDSEVLFDNKENSDKVRVFTYQHNEFIYRSISSGLFSRLGYQHIYPLYIKFDLPINLEGIDSPWSFRAQVSDGELMFWDDIKTLNCVTEAVAKLEASYENKAINFDTSTIIHNLKLNDRLLNNLKLFTIIEHVQFNNNINVYKEDKSIIIDNLKLEFKVNGNWLPWSQLSDGTKRLFYILSEVTYATGLILIEEPELGIHPHQFNLLMDFLKEQSEDKQIILSTHSPKALDHLNPDELQNILIANYDLDKGTQIRHLTDKETKKAKQYMKEVGFFSDYWLLSDLE